VRNFLNFVMLDFTAIIYICPSKCVFKFHLLENCAYRNYSKILLIYIAIRYRSVCTSSTLATSFSQTLFTSMIDCKQVHKRLKYKQYFSILFSTEWRQSIRVRQTFRRGQVPDPSETVRGRPASAHPTVQPIRSGCYCWKVNQVLLKHRLYICHLFILILIMKRLFEVSLWGQSIF